MMDPTTYIWVLNAIKILLLKLYTIIVWIKLHLI